MNNQKLNAYTETTRLLEPRVTEKEDDKNTNDEKLNVAEKKARSNPGNPPKVSLYARDSVAAQTESDFGRRGDFIIGRKDATSKDDQNNSRTSSSKSSKPKQHFENEYPNPNNPTPVSAYAEMGAHDAVGAQMDGEYVRRGDLINKKPACTIM